jgi:hypothetical protein
MPAAQFIERVLTDESLQTRLKTLLDGQPLSFNVWETAAKEFGFTFTEAELDTVFTDRPELMDRLYALAETLGITLYEDEEFELSEADLHAIAGGGNPNCQLATSGSSRTNKVSLEGRMIVGLNKI